MSISEPLLHHLRAQLASAQARCEEYKREVERRDELLRIDGYAEAMALATKHLQRAEAAEQKVKELEAAVYAISNDTVAVVDAERARIREGLEKLQRLGPSAWDGTPLPQSDGEWLRRADAIALVEKP